MADALPLEAGARPPPPSGLHAPQEAAPAPQGGSSGVFEASGARDPAGADRDGGAEAGDADAGAVDIVTGPELAAMLAQTEMPSRIMVRLDEGPAAEGNPYFRADVLALDRRGRRMQLRYQYHGDRAPFWLPLASMRLWRGCYPLDWTMWVNLGKVRPRRRGRGSGHSRAWPGAFTSAARLECGGQRGAAGATALLWTACHLPPTIACPTLPAPLPPPDARARGSPVRRCPTHAQRPSAPPTPASPAPVARPPASGHAWRLAPPMLRFRGKPLQWPAAAGRARRQLQAPCTTTRTLVASAARRWRSMVLLRATMSCRATSKRQPRRLCRRRARKTASAAATTPPRAASHRSC
jgi:hypothetical protein